MSQVKVENAVTLLPWQEGAGMATLWAVVVFVVLKVVAVVEEVKVEVVATVDDVPVAEVEVVDATTDVVDEPGTVVVPCPGALNPEAK